MSKHSLLILQPPLNVVILILLLPLFFSAFFYSPSRPHSLLLLSPSSSLSSYRPDSLLLTISLQVSHIETILKLIGTPEPMLVERFRYAQHVTAL